MDKKQCQECNSKIPRRAQFCPVCGHESGSTKKVKSGMPQLIVIAVLAISLMGFGGYNWMQKETESPENNHTHVQKAPAMSGSDLAQYASDLPNDYESLLQMGNSLMDQGNYAMASECYSKANNLRPGNPDLLVDLGTCLHSIGNNNAAISNFEAALLVKPDHVVAKFNMGIVYYALADSTKAIAWWQKILDENPTDDVRARVGQMMQMVRGQ